MSFCGCCSAEALVVGDRLEDAERELARALHVAEAHRSGSSRWGRGGADVAASTWTFSVPPDQADARIAAVIEAGGGLMFDEDAPAWWTLADLEGNEVDIATWQGRD
jgi:hypothetical protein